MSSNTVVPDYAYFFGTLGICLATSLTAIGTSYGTAKAGVAICCTGVMRPELVMKLLLPVVMAGIIAIYGLVVAVLESTYRAFFYKYRGFAHFSGGATVGLCGIAAGVAIGIISDSGVRGMAQQPRLFVGFIIILIFSEVLGLYGLIVGILMALK